MNISAPYKMLMVWKGWRPVAEKLHKELWGSATTAKPLQIVRIFIGLVINSAIILFGCLADPNIYSYILMVCLINMGLYFLNYIIAKVKFCGFRLLLLDANYVRIDHATQSRNIEMNFYHSYLLITTFLLCS